MEGGTPQPGVDAHEAVDLEQGNQVELGRCSLAPRIAVVHERDHVAKGKQH